MNHDIEAIHNLVSQYGWAVDSGSGAWKLFLEDGVLDLSDVGAPRLEGQAAIRAFGQNVRKDVEHNSLHLFSNPIVEVEGDHGTGRWAASVWDTMADGTAIFIGLAYHDTYVRTPEGWRFAERKQQFLVPPTPMNPRLVG